MERYEVIEKLRLFNLTNHRIPSHFYEDYEISVLSVTHSWTALKTKIISMEVENEI